MKLRPDCSGHVLYLGELVKAVLCLYKIDKKLMRASSLLKTDFLIPFLFLYSTLRYRSIP